MKESLIKIFAQDNGILRITLDDEGNKNALSEMMISELIEAISEANNSKEVKIIIIASTGNVYCSGHNLKEITAA